MQVLCEETRTRVLFFPLCIGVQSSLGFLFDILSAGTCRRRVRVGEREITKMEKWEGMRNKKRDDVTLKVRGLWEVQERRK